MENKTITLDGKSQDWSNPSKRKATVMHELGHYICARSLGYDSKIILDPTKRFYKTWKEEKENIPKMQALEESAIVGLGGLVAEEYMHANKDDALAGFMGDYKELFGIMKEIKTLKNQDFPYQFFLYMPMTEFKEYYDISSQIIEKIGGKQKLEEIADKIMPQLKDDNENIIKFG